MEALEKRALEEVFELLQGFSVESYRFGDLIKAKDQRIDKEEEYKRLSNEIFGKVEKAKYWVAAILCKK